MGTNRQGVPGTALPIMAEDLLDRGTFRRPSSVLGYWVWQTLRILSRLDLVTVGPGAVQDPHRFEWLIFVGSDGKVAKAEIATD